MRRRERAVSPQFLSVDAFQTRVARRFIRPVDLGKYHGFVFVGLNGAVKLGDFSFGQLVLGPR